jgi:hypothetical protein
MGVQAVVTKPWMKASNVVFAESQITYLNSNFQAYVFCRFWMKGLIPDDVSLDNHHEVVVRMKKVGELLWNIMRIMMSANTAAAHCLN